MAVKTTTDNTPTEQDAWGSKTDQDAPDWVASDDRGPHESDRDMITISLKGGSGTQAWLVGHFNSVDEALDVLEDPNWEELVALVVKRGNELQDAYGTSTKAPQRAAAGRSGSGWGSKTSSRSSGAQRSSQRSSEPVYDESYDCDHYEELGPRNWVQKDTWQAWMCPSQDKEDKCDPLWANKDGSLQTKRSRR